MVVSASVTGAYSSWDPSLIGFNWTNVGWYIQEAIWYIEQERDWAQINTYSRSLVMLANSQANSMNLAGVVRVMNITGFDGTPRQDQLVMVSVPDSGESLHLFAFAVLSLLFTAAFVARTPPERPACKVSPKTCTGSWGGMPALVHAPKSQGTNWTTYAASAAGTM
jgi:hypothetical protein